MSTTLTSHLNITVEWADCDPAQIVFYPAYFRWFDTATWNLFRKAGIAPQTLLNEITPIGIPLVNVEARFIKPIRFDDNVTVVSHIEHWSRKSFRVAHRIDHLTRDGATAVEGVETRFWSVVHPSDPKGLKAGIIPLAIKARFET